jgi:hypothetical protein
MKKHFLRACLAFASLGLCASQTVRAQLPEIQQQGSTQFVTGGYGQEESSAIKQAMSEFPLALTFTQQVEGRAAYLSNVQVVIRDKSDRNVLNVESHGPYLLVHLAQGDYHLHATYQNQTQSREINIDDKKTVRIIFEWK